MQESILNLADIEAKIDFDYVASRLVPPPRFEFAQLENYITDPLYPSQEAAKVELENYTQDFNSIKTSPFTRLTNLFSNDKKSVGIYLDGVFGIGKTHLLASVFHAISEPNKAYLSFTELMYFIGLVGLEQCAMRLSQNKLICIDEFELDDPGNTTMSLGFVERVLLKNVSIVATSNTPPTRLGEGRFAVQSFQREIGEISKRFKVIQIDGKDYRQKNIAQASGRNQWQIKNVKSEFENYQPESPHKKLFLNHHALLDLMRGFHPMHYIEIAERLDAVFLDGVTALTDQFDALRFVYLIDKLYDDNVSIFANAEVSIEELFPKEFYKSAYAKKYLRCTSRLKEICNT